MRNNRTIYVPPVWFVGYVRENLANHSAVTFIVQLGAALISIDDLSSFWRQQRIEAILSNSSSQGAVGRFGVMTWVEAAFQGVDGQLRQSLRGIRSAVLHKRVVEEKPQARPPIGF
jgi:hypothetical protein